MLKYRFIIVTHIVLTAICISRSANANSSSVAPPNPRGEDFDPGPVVMSLDGTTPSTGQRVFAKGDDFSIVPPLGWKVRADYRGTTLVMQAPENQPGDVKFKRTIQIMSGAEPVSMDAFTTRDFEEKLIKGFKASNAAISDYRIRNNIEVELNDGRKGILFYSEFRINNFEMMQANLLVSSDKRHYIATYTDLAEHFETEGESPHLNEAWDALTSIELGGPTPDRFRIVRYMLYGLGVILILSFFVSIIRRIHARRTYRDYIAGNIDDSDPITAHDHIDGDVDVVFGSDQSEDDPNDEKAI